VVHANQPESQEKGEDWLPGAVSLSTERSLDEISASFASTRSRFPTDPQKSYRYIEGCVHEEGSADVFGYVLDLPELLLLCLRDDALVCLFESVL
jgi:hypothetical protein